MKFQRVSDLFRRFADLLDSRERLDAQRLADPGDEKLLELTRLMCGYSKIALGVDITPRQKGVAIVDGKVVPRS